MNSDDNGDGATASIAVTSASSASYNVMSATQVKFAGGNCNPLFQVHFFLSNLFYSG